MLSSHKAVRPRGLHGSSTKSVISSPPATSLHPATSTTNHSSKRRDFSWGAKHTPGSKNAGKVWKGFSTHDHTRARKQLYRGTFWTQHYTPHVRRYLPIQEWRLSSSWGRSGSDWIKPDQAPTSKTKAEEKTEEDWYSRYQLQKKRQYDDFMKKMEEDPIGMLFGRKWADWVDGAEARFSHPSDAKDRGMGSASKNGWPIWEFRDRPQRSSQEPFEEKSTSRKPPLQGQNTEGKSPEYEIDPITNRRVKKMNVTPEEAVRSDMTGTIKVSQGPVSAARDHTYRTQQASEIPVKPFVPLETNVSSTQTPKKEVSSSTSAEEASSSHEAQDTSGWLAQEGFGQKQVFKVDKQSEPDIEAQKPTNADQRLESALDRHFRVKVSKVQDPNHATLQYKPEEKKTEDVDLLRSSDVRASAGLRGRLAKENDVEKQSRQRKLEEEYHNGSLRREKQLAQEVAEASRHQSQNAHIEREDGESSVKMKEVGKPRPSSVESSVEWVNHIAEPPPKPQSTETSKPTVQASTSVKLDKIKAQIVPLKARLDAVRADYDALRQRWLEEKRRREEMAAKKMKDLHEAEINSQKMAMEASEIRHSNDARPGSSTSGASASHSTSYDAINKPATSLQSYLPGEGDMASNVHEFARRDRWYKKKAPHANQEMDAKLQRLVNDRALIREVRDIYEETYGTIDTKHRQPALDRDKPESSKSLPPQAFDTVSQPAKKAHAFDSSITPSPSDPSPPQLKRDLETSKDGLPPQVSNYALSSDPLATVQRLFEALRQVQTLVQHNRTYLKQLSDPSQSQLSSISESSNASAIIQKLFVELRRAQAVVQEQRVDLEQPAKFDEPATQTQASKENDQSAKVKALKSAASNQSRSEQILAKGIGGPSDNANTVKLNDYRTGSGSESITSNSKDVNAPSIYRIMAFDSTQQKVISSETASVAPFSEEQRLLPAEALKLLKNPGKFLPDLMALHDKGYVVVSGTGKTLVLRKPATLAEIKHIKHEKASKELNPIDGTLPYRAGYPSLGFEDVSKSPSSPEENSTPGEERNAQFMGYPDSPLKTPSAPERAEQTSTDPATLESTAPTSESNLPPSDKVRREEAVFSGSTRGNWHEADNKRLSKKNKRAVKRSKKLKNMLWTGTLTAACCYAVGVISQMLQH